jgi:hypothetical protein
MGDIVFTSSGYAPTHQTSGIIKSDWRKLFTPDESKRFRYLVKNIDGDLSELPNSAMLTVECGLEGIETWTWLDVLQVSIDEWTDASVVSVSDPRVIGSTTALGVVGVLDDMSRIPVLLQGVPL